MSDFVHLVAAAYRGILTGDSTPALVLCDYFEEQNESLGKRLRRRFNTFLREWDKWWGYAIQLAAGWEEWGQGRFGEEGRKRLHHRYFQGYDDARDRFAFYIVRLAVSNGGNLATRSAAREWIYRVGPKLFRPNQPLVSPAPA